MTEVRSSPGTEGSPGRAHSGLLSPPDLTSISPTTPGEPAALARGTDWETGWEKTKNNKGTARESTLLLHCAQDFHPHQEILGWWVGVAGGRLDAISSPGSLFVPMGLKLYPPRRDGGSQATSTGGVVPQQMPGQRNLFGRMGLRLPSPTKRQP